MLLLLTDVDAVYALWGTPDSHPLTTLTTIEALNATFDKGSMGPKVEAACSFVIQTKGIAGIGSLDDALAIASGQKGTRIVV